MKDQPTIPCKECKKDFLPIITASGLHFSKLCRDCLIRSQNAKRKEAISKRDSKVVIQKKTGKSKPSDLMSKPLPTLLKQATTEFNLFIRNRDRLPNNRFYCPTCKKTKTIAVIDGQSNYQACHLFPAGHYPELRYNENNVWSGCLACNYYKHGVGYEYSDWVRAKIGEEEYQKLKQITENKRIFGFEWNRFEVIEIIKKYKSINKQYQTV